MNEEAIRKRVEGVIDALEREDKEAALTGMKEILTEFLVGVNRAADSMDRFAKATEEIVSVLKARE